MPSLHAPVPEPEPSPWLSRFRDTVQRVYAACAGQGPHDPQLEADVRLVVNPSNGWRRGDVSESLIRHYAERVADIRARRASGRPAVFYGVPGYFRGCCRTARAGGREGYSLPGYHLGLHVMEHVPDVSEAGDHETAVRLLCRHLEADDIDAAWSWIAERLPGCAAMIPPRRREAFLRGLARAHAEGRVE